jgi:hypothetical protein
MKYRTRFVAAAFAIAGMVAGIRMPVAALQNASSVSVDADDIGGVVMGAKGPEAGVWVIAETSELPTGFRRIVVTDDRGPFLVPDLPARGRSGRTNRTAASCSSAIRHKADKIDRDGGVEQSDRRPRLGVYSRDLRHSRLRLWWPGPHRGAWSELADHTPGMMTLISLATSTSFGK